MLSVHWYNSQDLLSAYDTSGPVLGILRTFKLIGPRENTALWGGINIIPILQVREQAQRNLVSRSVGTYSGSLALEVLSYEHFVYLCISLLTEKVTKSTAPPPPLHVGFFVVICPGSKRQTGRGVWGRKGRLQRQLFEHNPSRVQSALPGWWTPSSGNRPSITRAARGVGSGALGHQHQTCWGRGAGQPAEAHP